MSYPGLAIARFLNRLDCLPSVFLSPCDSVPLGPCSVSPASIVDFIVIGASFHIVEQVMRSSGSVPGRPCLERSLNVWIDGAGCGVQTFRAAACLLLAALSLDAEDLPRCLKNSSPGVSVWLLLARYEFSPAPSVRYSVRCLWHGVLCDLAP